MCEACKQAYEAPVVTLVEATDAYLVDQLFEDRSNRPRCAVCNTVPAAAVSPILYVDREHHYAALVYHTADPAPLAGVAQTLPEELRNVEPLDTGAALAGRIEELRGVRQTRTLLQAIAGTEVGSDKLLEDHADLIDLSLFDVLDLLQRDAAFHAHAIVAALLRHIGLLDDPETCSPRERAIITRCARVLAAIDDGEQPTIATPLDLRAFVHKITTGSGAHSNTAFIVCRIAAGMQLLGVDASDPYTLAVCRGGFGLALAREHDRAFEAAGYCRTAIAMLEDIITDVAPTEAPAIEKTIVRLTSKLLALESHHDRR